ncbi:MAG: translational GTPase TypA, partial [Lachnospiraceae bacterium]|nr:translational GTPase TypA [Lachnospiraceae bacterium]
MYKDVKINIIDTPGHADFGGEVERVLKMVNGVILLVDAFEGTMPQTKFVLKKALDLDLPVIVCINKIDRPEARPEEVVDEVLELLMDLDASDEQLECPFLYASAREGTCVRDLGDEAKDLSPLFETIIDYIPAPEGDPERGTQVLISTIDYNEYVGRIGIGKVDNGSIAVGQEIVRVNYHDPSIHEKTRITKLYEFDGLKKVDVARAEVGSIVAISGIGDLQIGDTICVPGDERPIPFQKISEPTIAMNFVVNDSPFAGQEGTYCTSRQVRERLFRELNTDVSLRVEDTDSTDTFRVSGRGELHLSVLIETMRREGYEFAVSKAEVIMKTDDKGHKLEPIESCYVNVPQDFSGTVISMLSERKGELVGTITLSDGSVRLEFSIPARGLLGVHGSFLTATKGTGVMNSVFDKYAPYKGEISFRKNGSLIAFESGEAVTYGLFAAQERGALFIGPNTKVYAGMVVGESAKPEDIEINVCKTKHLTNTRSSNADEALTLTPPRILSLEQALDYIDSDEYLEVTPKSLRIRKRILDSRLRKRANMQR